VANPANLKHYIAFAENSEAEPFPGGPEGDLRVRIKMTVAGLLGVSISGKPLELRWHPSFPRKRESRPAPPLRLDARFRGHDGLGGGRRERSQGNSAAARSKDQNAARVPMT
jgi:hypothetical protein